MRTFRTDTCLRHDLRFAPDGRWLLVGSQTRVLLDTVGSDPPAVLTPPTGAFTAHAQLVFGGRALVYATPTDNPNLHRWDFASGQVSVWEGAVWEGAGRNPGGLAASPDGTAVYVAVVIAERFNWFTELRAFDTGSGAPRDRWPALEHGLSDLVVSADGRRLAGRHMFSAGVWDLAAPGAPGVSIPRSPNTYIEGVALSADGSRLATVTNRGVALWNLTAGGPEEVFRSGKHRRRVSAVACSPTRPQFATGDVAGLVFLWDHSGRILSRYEWGLGEVYALCFAPDGLRCAAADDAGRVVVWDVDA